MLHALWPALSLHPAVHFFPVSHLHHKDKEEFVPNLIDRTVTLSWSHVYAIELLFRLQLLHSGRARTLLQAEKVPVHLLSDVGIELADIPLVSLSAAGVTSRR